MNTRITELLGIKYPILQGGMAWVAESTLAAAVSNAGGAGIIAGGAAPIDYLRDQIRRAKSLTDKPFGVNVMLMSPNAEDLAQLVIDEKVAFVTTGAGNPGKYMEGWKGAGIKVIPVVPSVALAKRMERSGADAVIAEGTESGGHIGENTTMCLVPQVVDAVEIPVLAAGGIADGRGVAASFMLGAEGVQVGTRFLASEECRIHANYKDLVLGEKDGGTPEEFEQISAGSLRKAVVDGDLENGSFMCGAIAGMINEIKPCKDIIEEMFAQAEKLLGK